MGDTWIESHTSLRSSKKLKPLCDELNITRAQAIGHLHMLWWWAIDNRDEGDLSGLFPRDIAAACDWHGDAQKLIRALKKTRWITSEMQIKDWREYAGRLLKDRERKRAGRFLARSSDVSSDSPGQVRAYRTEPIPNRTVEGFFSNTQEKMLRQFLATRLSHAVGSEVNHSEYKYLVESIIKDPKVKDPISVAIYRAQFGYDGKKKEKVG